MDRVSRTLRLVNHARLAILQQRISHGHPLPRIYMDTLKHLDGLALRLRQLSTPPAGPAQDGGVR